MLRKFLHEPLIHFLFIGGLLFCLYEFTPATDHSNPANEINISASSVKELREQWFRQHRIKPDQDTLHNLLESLIQQEVLYREARRLGLDENDTIVRRRLIQKMEFLSANMSRLEIPGDDVLLEYLSLNKEQYRVPEKRSFIHIYFNSKKRGENVFREIEAARNKLHKDDLPSTATKLGDNFILQSEYKDPSEKRVAQLFGEDFAKALFTIDTEHWQGPLTSEYGMHLVRITEVTASYVPDFAEIRAKLQDEFLNHQLIELKEKSYREMRERYTINVDYSVDRDTE